MGSAYAPGAAFCNFAERGKPNFIVLPGSAGGNAGYLIAYLRGRRKVRTVIFGKIFPNFRRGRACDKVSYVACAVSLALGCVPLRVKPFATPRFVQPERCNYVAHSANAAVGGIAGYRCFGKRGYRPLIPAEINFNFGAAVNFGCGKRAACVAVELIFHGFISVVAAREVGKEFI